jgi:hypothetical protein
VTTYYNHYVKNIAARDPKALEAAGFTDASQFAGFELTSDVSRHYLAVTLFFVSNHRLAVTNLWLKACRRQLTTDCPPVQQHHGRVVCTLRIYGLLCPWGGGGGHM